MGIRFSSTGGQDIYGVGDKFKFNPSMLSTRKRRGTHVLQLTTAKPDMVEVLAQFQAAHDGTRVDAGEFLYQSRSQYLYITNVEQCTGLVPAASVEYEIPLFSIPRSSTILTNIYSPEEYITTASGF